MNNFKIISTNDLDLAWFIKTNPEIWGQQVPDFGVLPKFLTQGKPMEKGERACTKCFSVLKECKCNK